jgi:molybdate transport system substrate-binding protein
VIGDRSVRRAVAGFVMSLVVVGCGGGSDTEILVSAAASLTDAFGEIEAAYEQLNPGVDVILNTGGSSTLREQILAGAPVDVFAAANEANIAAIVAAGEAGTDPVVFASNRMQIAVPPGNPAGVEGLSAFSDEELLIGLCAAGVPCGDLAMEILGQAGIAASVDTNEPNVRALLTKVEAGELDAGIVYATDVAISTVDGIEMPDQAHSAARYPIVVLKGAGNPEGARAFVDFVLSSTGQEILAGYGFSV